MANLMNQQRSNLERLSSLANRVITSDPEWESPLVEYSLDFRPNLDISEDEESYFVEAELPGLKKDDIDVTVSENNLVIQGKKREKKEEKNRDFHRIERRYGTFQRQVSIPHMDVEAPIEAEYSKGVLKVRVPKAEKAKTQKINVNVKD